MESRNATWRQSMEYLLYLSSSLNFNFLGVFQFVRFGCIHTDNHLVLISTILKNFEFEIDKKSKSMFLLSFEKSFDDEIFVLRMIFDDDDETNK